MNCEFEQMEAGKYRCVRCGFTINSNLNADKIFARCKNTDDKSQNMPSALVMVKNFGSSLLNYAANSFQSVSEHVKQERIKICEGCEYYTEDKRCSECGCFVHIKAGWASEKCPLDKWDMKIKEQGGGCGGCGKN